MKKFKIPRKLKKELKKGFWFYPPDENGGSLSASPSRDINDFKAYKKGVLRNLIDKHGSRQRQLAFRRKINKEILISDEELKRYVDDIIREDLRNSSYRTLLEAKKHPRAIIAYYQFVNSYQLVEQGEDSYGNICCMAIDRAKELLRKG
ncbi:hypothetical protein RM553_10165 [Zunongwangia sp. F363]|uniref:Uncharacterized protein n=1 Tax=Autumnicola tepida TaxID=3075595 RepID=A0ABU3CA22_9FLAO|nr:hypothetical protein [Zunongwangia sp. F363]MDT0643192.1 hypothetical protein [Zunongwangia sp. F363]